MNPEYLKTATNEDLAKEILINADGTALDKWATIQAAKALAHRIIPEYTATPKPSPHEYGRTSGGFVKPLNRKDREYLESNAEARSK
jgi:hypothetical protein